MLYLSDADTIYLAVLILITENPWKSQDPQSWAFSQHPRYPWKEKSQKIGGFCRSDTLQSQKW